MKHIDIATGSRYGTWTVLSGDRVGRRGCFVVCRCDCGKSRPVQASSLANGTSTSCGCQRMEDVRGTPMERLLNKTIPEPNSGCWLWVGASDDLGYGKIWFGDRLRLAHSASYLLHRGKIPAGTELDHTCRVPCCVNPFHLDPVTHAENVRRGEAGMLHPVATHCPNGHEITGENAKHRKGCADRCRICATRANTEYRIRLTRRETSANL